MESDVNEPDAWQMIYDEACELIETILSDRPGNKAEENEFHGRVEDVMRSILKREIDPREDWSVVINTVNNESALEEKIDLHFNIATRQSIYASILFEHDITIGRKKYSGSTALPSYIRKSGEHLIAAFACAQQHATAWQILKDLREKSYATRSAKATEAKKELKNEREILLRGMVKGLLVKRESGAWPGPVRASQDIARKMMPVIEEFRLPLPIDMDELSEIIVKSIEKEPSLRKAYNDNAVSPLPKPRRLLTS